MLKKLKNYLDCQKWSYHISDNDPNVVYFGIETNNGKFHCILDVDESEKKFIFFSVFPEYIPKKLRKIAAELLMRLNNKFFFGNFEMDFENGEIRFKTSFVYENCTLDNDVIRHIINGNIEVLDSHFKDLTLFASGEINIKEIFNNYDDK